MFKHILLPTDGSSRSVAAIDRAVRFAKEQGARVTGIYVAPPEQRLMRDDMSSMHRPSSSGSARARSIGRRYLREVVQTASEFGVPCDVICAVSERPYEEIARTAQRSKCDLIYMASHGRTGLSKLLLGSQTNKVLALSTVPVMVIR
jgi:nucleotide-binding universal stress UspA family protein